MTLGLRRGPGRGQLWGPHGWSQHPRASGGPQAPAEAGPAPLGQPCCCGVHAPDQPWGGLSVRGHWSGPPRHGLSSLVGPGLPPPPRHALPGLRPLTAHCPAGSCPPWLPRGAQASVLGRSPEGAAASRHRTGGGAGGGAGGAWALRCRGVSPDISVAVSSPPDPRALLSGPSAHLTRMLSSGE